MIELRTLGTFAVRDTAHGRGQDLPLAPRPAALLVYLALARPRGRVARDRLLGVFWPELPEARARAALSQTLYRLRVELGRDVVATTGDVHVELRRDEVHCDAVDFEDQLDRGNAERALQLYTGELLAGFHLSGAPEFEHWLEDERARLQNSAIDLAKDLAARERDRGRPGGALVWLRRANALAPYDEQVLKELIHALAAAGDVSGAVREYDAFAARLARDLELTPSAESTAMIRALRSPPRDRTSDSEPATREEVGVAAGGEAAADISPARTMSAADPAAAAAVERRNTWSRVLGALHGQRRHFIGASALLIAAVLLVLASSPTLRERAAKSTERFTPLASSAGLRPNRVLVLPLDAPQGDSRLQTVGRMAADWVTQDLQRTGLVEVIDAHTAFILFAEADSLTTPAMRQLAEGSHAGVIVWGSVHPDGEKLRFQVQITDARDGTVLRALDPIVGGFGEVSATLQLLRAKVAGALATVIDERLAALVAMSGAPPTFEAYQEFARGLDTFRPPWDTAYKHFERAAQLDSSFILASFWAAYALFNGARFSEQDSLVRALTARRDRLPPADQAGLDMFIAERRGDWETALSAAKRAAQFAPQSSWAYMAGLNAWRLGRPREALGYLETLDPARGWARTSPMWWSLRMNTLHQLGRFEEQLAVAHQARALFASQRPRPLGVDRMEIFALAALGRLEDLDRLLQEVLATLPARDAHFARDFHLFSGQELRAHGNSAAARRYFERCAALWHEPRCLYELGRYQELLVLAADTSSFDLSATLAHLGKHEEAMRRQAAKHANYNQGPAYTYGLTFGDARLAILAGDRARASAILSSEPQRGRLWEMVHWSGDFDSLRGHTVIEGLLSKD